MFREWKWGPVLCTSAEICQRLVSGVGEGYFEANLTAETRLCGESVIFISFTVKNKKPVSLLCGLILHTPGPEIPDLAYHIHSFLTLLTQLLTLLRHMILQWFQPKWLSMDLCIHSKTILLTLLRLLTCHYIKLSKVSNLSRGQNSCMNMPTHKHTSNIDIIWVYT